MNNQTNIERVVMRRVHTMRVLRLFFSNGALASYVFILALWGIGREVWVAQVLQNAPTNFFALPNFYLAAFTHTRFVVQTLSLITLAAVIILARETARSISSLFVPAHA
jgi:hypothetical protein